MFDKAELLKKPNYLLTKYQNEIYRQLVGYMESQTPNLTQKDVAEKLGVSSSYISQILNGNFNFTLKKLIELGLMIGKVPDLKFVDIDEYWMNRDKETQETTQGNIQKFKKEDCYSFNTVDTSSNNEIIKHLPLLAGGIVSVSKRKHNITFTQKSEIRNVPSTFHTTTLS